jgi:hypothetical protein
VLAFWRRRVDEIVEDPALRAYGVALCVGHLLAFAFWQQTSLPRMLSTGTRVCWPFFDDCADLGRQSEGFWQIVLVAYAGVSMLSALFLRGPRARLGVAGVAMLFVLHLAILFQDFRLRLNQHTMLMWVALAFLVAPHKRVSLKVLLLAFYFFAGILKLDAEWLSGAALGGHRPWLVPKALLPAACWYVVLLELVLIFGLFSRRKWLFFSTLLQLGLFHLTSFPIVGFFYPLLMLALLSIFVLDRYFPAPAVSQRAWLSAAWLVVPFGLLQLLPLAMPGDSALTGQGRFLALHMFDAKLSCRATLTLHHSARPPQAHEIKAKLPGRIACDPLVYFHMARGVCKSRAGREGFEDLDLKLVSKRQTGPLVTVVDQPSFCSKPVSYSALLPNPWIRGE